MPNLHMNCCKSSVLLRYRGPARFHLCEVNLFRIPCPVRIFFRSLYRACFHNCLGLNFRVEGIGVSVERSRRTLRFQLLVAIWRSSALRTDSSWVKPLDPGCFRGSGLRVRGLVTVRAQGKACKFGVEGLWLSSTHPSLGLGF